VELLLDGRKIAALDSPPWTAPVDFGMTLAPHELVVRALDEKGAELTRARQWINMPRPPAEAKILLERDAAGRARGATIAWQSLTGEEPSRVAVSFDGRTVAMDPMRRIVFPPHSPDTPHVLTVELEFASGLRSRDDVSIGGGAGEQAGSELTAVALRLTKKRDLDPAALTGCLVARGRPLRVVAAERGAASIWVVRDDGAGEALSALSPGSALARLFASADLPLKKDDDVRFLWPRPLAIPGAAAPTVLFPSSESLGRSDGGLAFLLAHAENPDPAGLFPAYADAVAVAGLNAFEGLHRRAVVLVLGEISEDASTYTPAAVRQYVGLLRVPLFVWSLERDAPDGSAWGPVAAIGTAGGLRAAYARLRQSLDSQVIVWVEGRYLPQEITLAPTALGLELVR
jgi:hypothetical protein